MKDIDREIIAKFMGLVCREKNNHYGLPQYWKPTKDNREKGSFVCYVHQLIYDQSWDMLMPVVDKIRQMKSNPDEMFMGTTVDRHLHFIAVTEKNVTVKLEHLYEEVVEFIKWYNQQVIQYERKITLYGSSDKRELLERLKSEVSGTNESVL